MNTPEKTIYTVASVNTGGRMGRADSKDASSPQVSLDFRVPPEMGGPGGGTNPEQLFAMGYGACFQGALGLAGKETGDDVSAALVRTTVGIGPEGDSFALTVKIEVHIPGVPVDQAQKLAERTHELCPYSKATRGNVPVEVVAVESTDGFYAG